MSTVDADIEVAQIPVTSPGVELTGAREARVGAMTVHRMLPLRQRRSVGAWCFADHYGPLSVDGSAGMRVPPHPHIGLQTVTWLLSGDVLHTDSLGSEQLIRPGELNLMTAGRGIAHAEVSTLPPERAREDHTLHGVQLWVALPDRSRRTEPSFEHHSDLPVLGAGGLRATVFMGALGGARSPALAFTGIVGAELAADAGTSGVIPLLPAYEHVVFAAAGSAQVAGTALAPGSMLYLGTGREHLPVTAKAGTRLILLGGEPLGEQLLMWWNFVARSPAEIAAAAADWREGRYAPVAGYDGDPMPAPPLGRLRA